MRSNRVSFNAVSFKIHADVIGGREKYRLERNIHEIFSKKRRPPPCNSHIFRLNMSLVVPKDATYPFANRDRFDNSRGCVCFIQFPIVPEAPCRFCG